LRHIDLSNNKIEIQVLILNNFITFRRFIIQGVSQFFQILKTIKQKVNKMK